MKFISLSLTLFILGLIQKSHEQGGFAQEEESRFISNFQNLIKDSYTAPLPPKIASKCKNQLLASKNIQTLSIKSSMTSDALAAFCGTNVICVIPPGHTVKMTSSLNMGALVVHGTVEWTDETQLEEDQYICAGYIAVR